MTHDEERGAGLSRRRMLQTGAAVGAAAWAVPVITTATRAGAATSGIIRHATVTMASGREATCTFYEDGSVVCELINP